MSLNIKDERTHALVRELGFGHALARVTGEPLLFKGDDFAAAGLTSGAGSLMVV